MAVKTNIYISTILSLNAIDKLLISILLLLSPPLVTLSASYHKRTAWHIGDAGKK
jgi:hypothetical protein